MKKLLSMVLSLTLVCSMIILPTTAKADTRVEINATSGGKIEPQNYLSQVEYNETTSVATDLTGYNVPSAGIYMHSRASSSNPFYEDKTALILWNLTPKSGGDSVTYKVPVTVADAGWYDLKYKVGGASSKDNMSQVAITVTDDDVTNDTGVLVSELHFGNETVNGTVSKKDVLSSVYMFENHGTRTYFEKGNYTVNITIYKSTSYSDIRIILDALRFIPASAEELTPGVENIFEYEDYNPFNGYANSSASGGKVLYDSGAKVVDSSVNPYIIRIPVKVDTAGEYKWSTVMAYKAAATSSAMKLYLDGELIADNSQRGTDVSNSNAFVSSTYPMHLYSGTKELPEGESVFELHITEGTNSAGKLRFAADYLALQCLEAGGGLPISSTEATMIELENYAEDFAKLIDENATVTSGTSGVYNKVTGRTTLSNGGATYINNATMPEGKTYISLPIPVSVSKAGYYDMEFCLGGANHTPNSSAIDIEIQGGSLGTKVIGDRHVPSEPDATYTGQVQATSATRTYKHKGIKTYLEEGDYTIKINVYGTRDSATTINFIADYIKLMPYEPEVVGITTKYFEFEDYDSMLIEDNSKAHGDKLLYDSWMFGTGKTFNVCIPMNIEESGYYNWEAAMTKSVGGHVSALTLSVDGEQIATNTVSGVNISDTNSDGTVDFMSSNFPMHRYNSSEAVYLEKGYREVVLSVAVASDNIYKYGADYFAIEKVVEGATEISPTVATTIELENYAEDIAKLINSSATVTEGTSGTYNKITNNSSLSGGGATYIKNATLPSGQSSVSLQVPVSVSKAGYYDVEFCVGGRSDNLQYVSKIDFEIDGGGYEGRIIGDRHVPSSPDATNTNKAIPVDGTAIYTHKGNAVYLEEGTYALKMNIYGAMKAATTVNMIADYIRLTPKAPKSVDHTKTYFEFEDYDTMLIKDNDNAHGDKLLYDSWMFGTGKTFDVIIPMYIEESGNYTWEAAMTKCGGSHVSALTLSVDGEQIATNTVSGVNISDTNGDGTVDFMSSSFPMHRYNSSEMLYLEEGYHEVALSAGITADNVYKYGADYFALEKYIEPLTATAKENSAGDGFDITFNYAPKTETLTKTNIIVKNAEGTSVDYTASLSDSGLVYTVKPAGGLASDCYTVTVQKDIVGAQGNVPSEDITLPVMTTSASYATASVEYDIYMGGDAPYDSSATYKNNVESGNILTTTQGSATFCTTQTPFSAVEGWYHIKADLSFPKQIATVTMTMPDGSKLTRGSYTYIYVDYGTAFTDIIINADSDYIKNVKLSTDSGSVISRTAEAQKTYDGIFNIVTTFFGDEKTTRGFAWSATEDHTDMVIRYAKADANFDTSYIQKAATYELYDGQLYYKVDISGLEAGTKYVYMVGDTKDNVWTDKYEIETEKEDNHEFSFIALTDPQGSSVSDYTGFTKTLQAATEDAPDAKFMVELGDLVNLGYSEDQWKMYFNASQDYTATLPHMAVMGNHETRDDGKGTLVSGKHFGLHFNNPKNGGKAAIGDLKPEDSSREDTQGVIKNIEETIYSFDYGDAHFVTINTGSDFAAYDETVKLLKAQKDWIKQDIESSDKKWTIVLSHQGLYPAKEERYFGSRAILEDLFVECGVDLVLQGHDHMVSRTYPMKGGTIQTKTNTDVITEDSGIVYFIPGAAANKRYTNLSSSPAYMNKIVNTDQNQPVYSVFNVTEDEIEVVTKQINGEVVDTFSIVATPEITLSEDTTQKTITVKTEYDEAVSGTEIAGFYKGDVLVKTVIGDVLTNATEAELTAEDLSKADFDEVRIFIWDIKKLIPNTAAKSRKIR